MATREENARSAAAWAIRRATGWRTDPHSFACHASALCILDSQCGEHSQARKVGRLALARHELWRIRKAIDGDKPGRPKYLVTDEIAIGFDAHTEYWLDVSILAEANADAAASHLIEMLSVYRGELLPGFYDEWVLLERERLQAVFEQKMARLMDRLIEEHRWAEAQEWGERWIALGQTPEPAYRALMTAHSAEGDMSKVAAVYQRAVQALRSDLGVDPSEQTRALYERLVGGRQIADSFAAQPQDASIRPPSVHRNRMKHSGAHRMTSFNRIRFHYHRDQPLCQSR